MKRLRVYRPFFRRRYNAAPRRLKSEKKADGGEVRETQVLKGKSRRIIVVESPDPRVFEQAIFVVRDDFLRRPGVSQKELMREARAAANGYMAGITKRRGLRSFFRAPLPFMAAAGAAATGIAYVVLHMSGVA